MFIFLMVMLALPNYLKCINYMYSTCTLQMILNMDGGEKGMDEGSGEGGCGDKQNVYLLPLLSWIEVIIHVSFRIPLWRYICTVEFIEGNNSRQTQHFVTKPDVC